ncbi:hypothetical protein WCLP8_4340002 [uncultured Gammaproteobacteria bacterium]
MLAITQSGIKNDYAVAGNDWSVPGLTRHGWRSFRAEFSKTGGRRAARYAPNSPEHLSPKRSLPRLTRGVQGCVSRRVSPPNSGRGDESGATPRAHTTTFPKREAMNKVRLAEIDDTVALNPDTKARHKEPHSRTA